METELEIALRNVAVARRRMIKANIALALSGLALCFCVWGVMESGPAGRPYTAIGTGIGLISMCLLKGWQAKVLGVFNALILAAVLYLIFCV